MLVCALLLRNNCMILLFFFFQAEDGIRDLTVTGVQTCALPISEVRGQAEATALMPEVAPHQLITLEEMERRYLRSEEHTSELQSQSNLVCRLLLEKKKKRISALARHTHTLHIREHWLTGAHSRP